MARHHSRPPGFTLSVTLAMWPWTSESWSPQTVENMCAMPSTPSENPGLLSASRWRPKAPWTYPPSGPRVLTRSRRWRAGARLQGRRSWLPSWSQCSPLLYRMWWCQRTSRYTHLATRLVLVGDALPKVEWYKDGKLLETGGIIINFCCFPKFFLLFLICPKC